MTSLYLEDSEFGFGYGAIVNGIGYISVESSVEIECNCNQYEIDMFFESDEMFEDYTQEDDDYAEREMQDELISPCSYLNQFYFSTVQLHNELFVHSVDTRVGF